MILSCTVSDALEEFHEALPHAEVRGKVLTFADNTTMLGMEDLTSNFLFRDCYGPLLELIQAAAATVTTANIPNMKTKTLILVTGAYGIGKSFIAVALLVEMRKQGITVVYQAGNRGWFRFSDEGVEISPDGRISFDSTGYFDDSSA